MDKASLNYLYVEEKMSVKDIADNFGFSQHKVDYWLKKHDISKRTIAEALYRKKHGKSDEFLIKDSLSDEDKILYGLGVGIYWGEGNKKNIHAVRVGNTDAGIIKTFVLFLNRICGVDLKLIRFGLQLFSDVSESDALKYWQIELNITRKQVMPTVNRIKSGKMGTYKLKNQFGVMTVYVYNKKLRDWMVDQLNVPL